MQRPEEQLVELAVEQRSIGEGAAEDEPVPPDSGLHGEPPEQSAEAGDVASEEEGSEPPAQALRLLGVDQAHGPHPRVAGQRVPDDQPAAVVADGGEVVEPEQVDHASDGLDVLVRR